MDYYAALNERYGVEGKPIKLYSNTEGVNTLEARVENSFTNDFAAYLLDAYRRDRIPQFLQANNLSYSQLAVVGNMLENCCDLQAYIPNQKVRTIEKEIAVYRSCVYRGTNEAIVEDAQVSKTLFIEYLLKAFVCFVEFFNPVTGVVQKCIATRNIELIHGLLPDIEAGKLSAMKVGLEMRYDDIKNGEIGVYPLKVDKKLEKKGIFKVAGVGRKTTYSTMGTIIRVMPVSQLVHYMRYLLIGAGIARDFVKVVYLKDDGSVRCLMSTGDVKKLTQLYGDADIANELADGCKVSWERGYLQVPDVELPINEYGCRAINLGRLIGIYRMPSYQGSPYLHIDLANAVQAFTTFLMSYATNLNTLMVIGVQLKIEAFTEVNAVTKIANATTALEIIKSWVTLNNNRNEKEFRVAIHEYMLANPTLYPNYSGLLV